MLSESELNILSNGNGLCNTHVHLEDVQLAIEESFDTQSQLGPNAEFTVVGDGNGFLSRVILVKPDWTSKNETLPDKLILKIASCVHIKTIIQKLKMNNQGALNPEKEKQLFEMFEVEAQQLHNREVNMYKIFEKWNKNDTILNSKVYFSKKFTPDNSLKGFIGMEYIENPVIRHMYVNCQPHELHAVLKSIANLQASGFHLSDEDKESLEGYDATRMIKRMTEDGGLENILRTAKKINAGVLDEKVERLVNHGLDLINLDIVADTNKFVGIEHPVLVHGDLWSANILWNEKNGEHVVKKVIDYQMIHFGNPAEDLIRLFLSTLSGADCRNHHEKLLEVFYEYLFEATNGDQMPYSLEQLKESYRLHFVPAGLKMLPMYGPIAQMKLSMGNEEDIEMYRQILTEKTEHLLDDMDKFYSYTQKFMENFQK